MLDYLIPNSNSQLHREIALTILLPSVSFSLSYLQCLEHCEAQHLFEVLLPAMVDLALSAPLLCTMVSIVDHFYYVYSVCLVWGDVCKSKDQQCYGKWRKDVQSAGRRGKWLDGGCYTRSTYELQLLDNKCPFLVHIKNCFFRNEDWERRGLSHVQSTIWGVMLMKFKILPTPLDFQTSHYSYEQYILRNG